MSYSLTTRGKVRGVHVDVTTTGTNQTRVAREHRETVRARIDAVLDGRAYEAPAPDMATHTERAGYLALETDLYHRANVARVSGPDCMTRVHPRPAPIAAPRRMVGLAEAVALVGADSLARHGVAGLVLTPPPPRPTPGHAAWAHDRIVLARLAADLRISRAVTRKATGAARARRSRAKAEAKATMPEPTRESRRLLTEALTSRRDTSRAFDFLSWHDVPRTGRLAEV